MRELGQPRIVMAIGRGAVSLGKGLLYAAGLKGRRLESLRATSWSNSARV